MNNSEDNLIEIESFPFDDKTYVVINYGGFIKNYSFAIDIPLVNVTLGVVIDGVLIKDAITILVGLPELSTVRIGTMWKNRKRLDTYWNKYDSYDELIPLTFDLEESPAECIIYKKVMDKKGLTEINLSKNESLELEFNDELYGSTFVKFKSKNNTDFIVPSIELLMSTYLPRNKLIRNEIVLKSVDTVIQNYINDYSIVNERYNINIDKGLEIETMYFLAYMACNKKSKSNISKIWTSLECSTSDKIKYPFILPYHPKIISFKATGIWIEENLFYIQRIYEPQVPSEIKTKFSFKKTLNSSNKPIKNDIQDIDNIREQNKPLNQNIIEENLNVSPLNNPGSSVGIKYIVSEVSPNNENLDYEIDETVITADNYEQNNYIKTDVEVEGASSGKLSESKNSITIARTIYTIEENPKEISLIKEISDSLEKLKKDNEIKELVYIDDKGDEHESLIYATFYNHHINLNDNKYWASGYIKGSGMKKAESGYRKILIVKFIIEGKKPLYLLEIVRKIKSDSFYGIIFQTDCDITFSDLETIKYTIASNKGKFRGKDIKRFPIDKVVLYKHNWGRMIQRFKNIINLIEQRNIFD